MKSAKFFASFAAVLAIGAANAVAVTYTFSGSVAGRLGGVTFSARDITIVVQGDTSGITATSFGFSNQALSNLITISGVGSASFTQNMGVFMNNGNGVVGFGLAGSSDTYDVEIGGTHDLRGPFGPKTGRAFGNPGTIYSTTQGEFVISSFESPGTYSVDAVPEPGTLLVLAGAGLAQAVARRRNRKSS